jgi:cell division protein FtsQ
LGAWAKRGAKIGGAIGVTWGVLFGAREVMAYATTSPRFETRSLIFEDTPHLDHDEARKLLALPVGANILALDLDALGRRVAADPWVASATVVRHLPDTLELRVVEHEPAAVVVSGAPYLVDANGSPFKRARAQERGQLPVITGVSVLGLAAEAGNPGSSTEAVRRALELVEVYDEKRRPRLGEIHLAEDGAVFLYTAETGTQLRLGRNEAPTALARYDALRAALGPRAERLEVVHLDATPSPDRRERVVARFTSEADEAAVVSEVVPVPESVRANSDSQPEKPGRERNTPKRKRIPRYE